MAPSVLEFSEFVHRRAVERDWAIANRFKMAIRKPTASFYSECSRLHYSDFVPS